MRRQPVNKKTLLNASVQTLVLIATVAVGVLGVGGGSEAAAAPRMKKIPVILDLDIGDDIDDTWALGMALRSPEIDLKLVVGDQGKPLYRAKLIAKFLEAAGRSKIPVGIGMETAQKGEGGQAEWVKDYDLDRYPGKVHKDGVQAIIDTIMRSREPVTLLAIGPLPNIAAALEREPRIAQRARFVGMHGSVRIGYGGSKTPHAEFNVKQDVRSAQRSLSAPWEMTITPLDTCGLIDLQGERYRKVRDSHDPIAAAIIENYRLWSAKQTGAGQQDPFQSRSSTLFDTVAVYLVFSTELLKMERLPITVNDEGFTVINPTGKPMNVATEWKDLDAFRDLLVERLTNGRTRR
jgi:inosine-uridine nucleoside N-ribohydrolase